MKNLINFSIHLTFLTRMALSFRARSWPRILRSKFFLASTRFSEFLMWWVCSFFIKRSIPVDCIFLCRRVKAWSRLLFLTFTRIARHCCSSQFTEPRAALGRVKRITARFATEFIVHWGVWFSDFLGSRVWKK